MRIGRMKRRREWRLIVGYKFNKDPGPDVTLMLQD
jgi:hypothetical protein